MRLSDELRRVVEHKDRFMHCGAYAFAVVDGRNYEKIKTSDAMIVIVCRETQQRRKGELRHVLLALRNDVPVQDVRSTRTADQTTERSSLLKLRKGVDNVTENFSGAFHSNTHLLLVPTSIPTLSDFPSDVFTLL